MQPANLWVTSLINKPQAPAGTPTPGGMRAQEHRTTRASAQAKSRPGWKRKGAAQSGGEKTQHPQPHPCASWTRGVRLTAAMPRKVKYLCSGSAAGSGKRQAASTICVPARQSARRKASVPEGEAKVQHKPEKLSGIDGKVHHPAGDASQCWVCIPWNAAMHATTHGSLPPTSRRCMRTQSPDPQGREAPPAAGPAQRAAPRTCRRRAPCGSHASRSFEHES